MAPVDANWALNGRCPPTQDARSFAHGRPHQEPSHTQVQDQVSREELGDLRGCPQEARCRPSGSTRTPSAPGMLRARHHGTSGRPGGQHCCSDLAIVTALTPRAVFHFHLPLGFGGHLSRTLGLICVRRLRSAGATHRDSGGVGVTGPGRVTFAAGRLLQGLGGGAGARRGGEQDRQRAPGHALEGQ